MNDIGNVPATTGFNQFHQTANPTSAVQSQSAQPAAAITPFAIAVPVYPVALIPAFMMAQPQFAQAGITSGGNLPATESGDGGAHVTANPTNATQADAASGFSAFGNGFGVSANTFGGTANAFGGMPFMMSPVLMAIGFPVMGFYGAPTAPSQGATPPAAEETPLADEAVVDVVDADLVTDAPPALEVADSPVVVDVVPVATDNSALPTLPISDVSAADFAKYRMMEAERKSETSLLLELSTLDGDQVTLDFSQIDIENSSRFNGTTSEGERMQDESFLEDTQRLVNMEVSGSLSADEQGAIDQVLSAVMEVVQNFFSGDMDAAVDKLQMMDFDSSQLAELSLQMSMTKTAVVNRGYHDGVDQLHDLKAHDADISHALEFLASEQRRLVEVAGSVFDTPSAAKLVKSLLPPMLSQPFADLQAELAGASETSQQDSASELGATEAKPLLDDQA